MLSDPDVPGSEKRSALAPIVERVICQKGGTDVVFAPGLVENAWGGDGPFGEEGGARHIYQTACIVCRVENSVSVFTTRRLPTVQRSAI